MIDAILNKMALAGKAESTVGVAFAVLRNIFSEAEENGYIDRSPVRRVVLPRLKPQKDTRILTIEEAVRIMALPVTRITMIFRIMLSTGARISEVLALTKADLTPGGLRIDESVSNGRASSTKNRKVRTVPLSQEFMGELLEWAAQQKGELMFPGRYGDNFKRRTSIAPDLAELRKQAGISDLTPRMCRPTAATLVDGDPRDIQAMLGHSSVDLTMKVYRRPQDERLRAAMQEYEARIRGKVVVMEKKVG